MDDQNELVTLRQFPTKIEAELARSTLAVANIESSLSPEARDGVRPGRSTSGVALKVKRKDATRAADVIGSTGRPWPE